MNNQKKKNTHSLENLNFLYTENGYISPHKKKLQNTCFTIVFLFLILSPFSCLDSSTPEVNRLLYPFHFVGEINMRRYTNFGEQW